MLFYLEDTPIKSVVSDGLLFSYFTTMYDVPWGA